VFRARMRSIILSMVTIGSASLSAAAQTDEHRENQTYPLANSYRSNGYFPGFGFGLMAPYVYVAPQAGNTRCYRLLGIQTPYRWRSQRVYVC
jgi:hypothetical protein